MKALFPLREGYFSLHWIRGILAIRRRACVSLLRGHIGELVARCLSIINRGQDYRQQSLYTIVLDEASDALLWSGKTAQLKFGEQ